MWFAMQRSFWKKHCDIKSGPLNLAFTPKNCEPGTIEWCRHCSWVKYECHSSNIQALLGMNEKPFQPNISLKHFLNNLEYGLWTYVNFKVFRNQLQPCQPIVRIVLLYKPKNMLIDKFNPLKTWSNHQVVNQNNLILG